MRRTLLGTGLVTALFSLALFPAGAIARQGHARHGHGHKRQRANHGARLQTFGRDATPTQSPQNAGTVASFTNGVLTINLTGGGTASGTVTSATEIKCDSATAPPSAHGDFASPAETGDSGEHGQQPPSTNPPPPNPGQASGEQGDGEHGDAQHGQNGADESNGQNENESEDQTCTTADLTPGAVVREAELRLTSHGATFSQVELVR